MSEDRKDDTDDELGLDESLSSMRSMWRDMADEEPSDRGMAALLAAAREKADQMRPKESWWAKLVDVLRRPPVLAMATVVVLIGGAVVISQRKDELKTESETASTSRGRDSREPVATPAPANDGVVVGPAGSAAPIAEPAADPAPPESVKQNTVRPHPRPKLDEAKKSTVAPAETKPQTKPGATFDTAVEKPADKSEAKKEPASGALQIASGDEDDMQPKGTAESTSTAPAAPPDHKSVSRKPLPSIEGEDRAAKDSTVAQLIKQCEAAAAKNDCAAVRTIASKIAQQDPQTYRNRVVKNAKVARCLEPAPPTEAMPVAE